MEDPENCDWIPLFLSWKDHKEYTRNFRDVADQNRFKLSLSTKEKDIMEEHDLTLQQMHWRRHTLINKCGGDEDKFKQEYPLTDEEAFITSGKRVFREQITKPQEKNIIKPKCKGNVELVNGVPLFIPDDQGDVVFYKMPQRGHRYVIGGDSSKGTESGDPACGQVLDRTTWEQVAVLHGALDPEVFAHKMAILGRYFNYALLAPESNFHGIVVVRKLVEIGYPNICKRMKTNVTDQGQFEEVEDLGWITNQRTKPVIISDLKEALREILLIVHDAPTLSEIKHYSILAERDSGMPLYGGAGGFHDDRVIALCIAVHFAKELPEELNNNLQDEDTRPRLHTKNRLRIITRRNYMGEGNGKINDVPGVGAAKVFLGEDHILRVEIDLNVPEGLEVEGRVGAYGTLDWAREIASRYFMMQEMKKAQKIATEQKKKAEFGVIMPSLQPKLPN